MGRKASGSGAASNKRGSVAKQVQKLRQEEGIDEVVAMLRGKPQLLGPCLHALKSGLLIPAEDHAADKATFSSSCIRYKDLPAYYLKTLLPKIDPNWGLVKLTEVAEKSGCSANLLAYRLLYYACVVPPTEQLACTHRCKDELTMNLKQRCKTAGNRLQKLTLTDGALDWSKQGVYCFDKLDADAGRFTQVRHVSGAVRDTPDAISIDADWTIQDNWLEGSAMAYSKDRLSTLSLSGLFKGSDALKVGATAVAELDEAKELGMAQVQGAQAEEADGSEPGQGALSSASSAAPELQFTPPPCKKARRCDAGV